MSVCSGMCHVDSKFISDTTFDVDHWSVNTSVSAMKVLDAVCSLTKLLKFMNRL